MLVENRPFDYSRVTLPNSGGITEYMKHAALRETHYVGLIPHFTGPVAEAALVHCLCASSDPARADLVDEITEQDRPISLCRRPDGSITNW